MGTRPRTLALRSFRALPARRRRWRRCIARGILCGLLLALGSLLAACTGFGGARRQLAAAPGDAPGEATPGRGAPDAGQPGGAQPASVFAVRALWIRADPESLARAGLGAGKNHAILSEAERDELLRVLRAMPDVEVRPAALLAAQDDREVTRSLEIEAHSYVRDWEIVEASGEEAALPRPTVGLLHVGRTIEVRVRATGGRIEVSGVSPQVAELAGVRRLAARLVQGEREWRIEWEEPTFVLARADAGLPRRLVLAAGESLLVRLRRDVVAEPAAIRRSPFVREVREVGAVREVDRSGGARAGGVPELDGDHFAVLIAVAPLSVEDGER